MLFRSRWIHLTNGSDDLPGVADGVDGVFDADDVLVDYQISLDNLESNVDLDSVMIRCIAN